MLTPTRDVDIINSNTAVCNAWLEHKVREIAVYFAPGWLGVTFICYWYKIILELCVCSSNQTVRSTTRRHPAHTQCTHTDVISLT